MLRLSFDIALQTQLFQVFACKRRADLWCPKRRAA